MNAEHAKPRSSTRASKAQQCSPLTVPIRANDDKGAFREALAVEPRLARVGALRGDETRLVAAARLIWRGTRPHSTTRVNASRCCPRAKDSSSPAPKATNQRQWWQSSLGRGTRLGEARSINCGEQFSHISGESRPAPCSYQHYCLLQ